MDGIVIERKVDPGQTVAASFQTPELFTIAPEMDKHMYVYASVDEADIGLIRAAQERNRAGEVHRGRLSGRPVRGRDRPDPQELHHDAKRRHLPRRHRGAERGLGSSCRA